MNAYPGSGSLGKLPISRFVVMEGEAERHRPSPGVAAGSSSPVLRILLTTVMCLSNCAQEVACSIAAFPISALSMLFCMLLLTSHSLSSLQG